MRGQTGRSPVLGGAGSGREFLSKTAGTVELVGILRLRRSSLRELFTSLRMTRLRWELSGEIPIAVLSEWAVWISILSSVVMEAILVALG
jgi:hypothetical protein